MTTIGSLGRPPRLRANARVVIACKLLKLLSEFTIDHDSSLRNAEFVQDLLT